MVLDSSALLAILFGGGETERLAQAIASDPKRLLSVFTALETAIVVEARKGCAGGRELDLLIHRAGVEIVPMTAALLGVARGAWSRFGRKRNGAHLTIGDCCAYALSRASGEPLLFTGERFSATDITPAAW